MRLPFAALMMATVAAAAPVPKPDLKNVWVGSTVVVKQSSTMMTVKVANGTEQVRVGIINPTVVGETEKTIEISYAGKTGTLNKDDVVRADADGVAYFDKKIADGPTADLYRRRAVLHRLRGKLDDALTDVNEAIKLSPSGAAYASRGQLQTARKDYEAALADYDRALKINPDDPYSHRGRGTVFEQTKKPDEALAAFAKANELMPDPGTYTSAGRVLAGKKEWAKACEQYDTAVKLNPKYALAYQARATARFELKDDKGGADDLDEAVKLLPNDPQGYVSRGTAFARRGMYADANRDFSTAIRLNPKHVGALNMRAWVAATCPEAEFRDADRAIDAATKACEATDWKAAGNLDTLAAAYAEAGKWEEAIKWQKKALTDAALLADQGDETKKRLALYEAKKPFRDTPKWKR